MSDPVLDTGLDGIQPMSTTETSQPVQEVKAEVTTQGALQPLSIGDLSIDGIEPDDGSVVVGDSALKVSQFPVDRIKFSKDRQYLLSIPTPQVIGIKTHFEEKIGFYKCFNGICCDSKPPSVRYVRPCIIYDVSSQLKVVSKELKFASLVFGQDNHDFLSDIFTGLDITEWDIIIKCTEEKYQKLQIRRSSTQAVYRQYPDMVKKVNEFWTENYKHILKPLFNVYTKEELLKKRADVRGSVSDEASTAMSTEDMEKVFK